MMNKIRFLTAALVIVAMQSTQLQASLLSDLIDIDNQVDTLVDGSVGRIIDKNGTADTLDPGDWIEGLIYFNQIDNTSAGQGAYSGTVWAAYAFEVDQVANDGSWYTLKGRDVLAAIGGDASNPGDIRTVTDYYGRVTNGAVSSIVVLENTTVSAQNLSVTNGANGLNGNLDSNWNISLTATLDDYRAEAKTGVDLRDITASTTSGSAGDPFADFYGVFSVTGHSFLPGTNFARIKNNPLSLINGSDTFGEISVNDGTLRVFDPTTGGAGWDYSDKGNFKINPTPEPSTIAIWAALGLGGCGFVARRRMKAKKA